MRYGTKVRLITKNVPNFQECPKGEVRRISIPRTRVNKGKKRKGSAESSSRALQDAG